MNFTPSRDDEMRVDLRVTFRLSTHDLATAFVAGMRDNHRKGNDDDYVLGAASLFSEARILRIARMALEQYGAETYHYYIGDNNWHELAASVRDVFNQRWLST